MSKRQPGKRGVQGWEMKCREGHKAEVTVQLEKI